MKNNYKYQLLMYWSEEDNACIVEVPELPGCMADGETYEKALEHVQVIIEEWIETAVEEGREIPEPKGKVLFV